MVSLPVKVVVGTLMRLSSPTAEPRSTEVMLKPVVAVVSVVAGGIVVSAGVVAAGGGVVSIAASLVSSALLQPASASTPARAATRVALGSLRIMGDPPCGRSVMEVG